MGSGRVSCLQVLIPLALISLAATTTASAQTQTVTVDIPGSYKRAASEKCQIDEGTEALFIIRFTPALDRYLHTGYRLLIDNKPVEYGAVVSNPKGGRKDSDWFIWDTENTVHEPDGIHEYTLELRAANTEKHDYVVGTPRSQTVTVCDNEDPPPTPPVVVFATASSTVSEEAGTKNVAVHLDPAPQSGIMVSYSVAGTATAGSDYTLAGTVSVAPGVSRVNLPIKIIDDEIEDGGETVVLTLDGGSDYTVGNPSRHTLTITNDDKPPEAEATFAAASSTADEGAGPHNIRINLSPLPTSEITIGYRVGGSATAGSDYTTLGSVTVLADTGSVTIPVTIADDKEVESSETVVLTLTGGTGYTVGSASGHTLTITDNDTPSPTPVTPPSPITPPATTPAAVAATVAISDASAEEGGPVTFTVRSEPAASAPMTLSWTVADGSAVAGQDYAGSPGGTVTISAGAGSATIEVATTDDRIDENDETFTIALSDDLPAGVSFAVDGSTATGTIHDDDTAGIALSEQAIWIPGTGGSVHYAVRLESEPEAPVKIMVTSDSPGVATVSPQRLVFTRSDWTSAKTVTITGAGIGDAVVVHEASSADSNYAGLRAKVRIRVDNDLVEVAAPWMARFARTSAGNVLDGITNRRTALRTPGFEGAVAGRSIDFAARTDNVFSTPGDRFPGSDFQPLSAGEVLPTTGFALTGEQAEGGGSLALWGHGVWSHFDGTDGSVTLEGEVASGILGIDGTVGSWLLGLALSHNAGSGGYHRASSRDGDLQASLTIAAPYAVGHVSDRLTVYGALGYGGGALTVEPLGWQALQTRIGFAMAAAGTRVDIVQAARAAGFGLTATTDAMLIRASSQAAGDALAAFDADVSQLRVGLTGSWRKELAAFGAVQPRLEFGARHDGGHAETGVGLEIGGGVRWSVPALGLGVTAESRALIAHVDDRLTDWGASAALSWDPAPASSVGPALSLRHDWGGASSDGLGALATATRFNTLAESEVGQKLLTAEAVWGIALPDAGLISSPYVGFEGTESARDYTLGWRITPAAPGTSDLSIGVSATRRELQGETPDHLFGVELNGRW